MSSSSEDSSSSSSEELTTTNKKPRRQYVRCGNSILCIFCNQYHQKKREGKCQNICKELPLFTDYIKENDLSQTSLVKKTLMSSTPHNTTELSIRRIMAYMNERKDDFRQWSTTTDNEIGSERPSIPRILQINDKKLKKELTCDTTISTKTNSTNSAPIESTVEYVVANEHKGPAPRLLSYEYLKNLEDINY
jgi:hypothetical protein